MLYIERVGIYKDFYRICKYQHGMIFSGTLEECIKELKRIGGMK